MFQWYLRCFGCCICLCWVCSLAVWYISQYCLIVNLPKISCRGSRMLTGRLVVVHGFVLCSVFRVSSDFLQCLILHYLSFSCVVSCLVPIARVWTRYTVICTLGHVSEAKIMLVRGLPLHSLMCCVYQCCVSLSQNVIPAFLNSICSSYHEWLSCFVTYSLIDVNFVLFISHRVTLFITLLDHVFVSIGLCYNVRVADVASLSWREDICGPLYKQCERKNVTFRGITASWRPVTFVRI